MFGPTTLRRALLLGTALTTLGSTADAADKWLPYVEGYASTGTERQIGGGEVFYPILQSDDDLLFANLRGRVDDEGSLEGNFGAGYRTQIDESWILGGYGYLDVKRSENDNTFWNLTAGIEVMSRDWDLRVNGYLPVTGAREVGGHNELVLTGTFIGLRAGEEDALHGMDGEIGWRVPLLPADGDQDVRLYAGGFWFANENTDTIAGPRARLEYRLYDPFGNGSRLTLGTQYQWDEVRGSDLSANISLRIPFTFFSSEQQARLTGLDRRMVDRVQRDVDVVTAIGHGDIEAVRVENLLQATHEIRFVDGDDDLQDRVGEAGETAIIVLQGGAGAVEPSEPLILLDGQALVGGGHTVKLTGAESGEVVYFTPAGERPTLVGLTNSANAVTLGYDNFVGGLDITGNFQNGIGGETERANIRGNSISGGQQQQDDDLQIQVISGAGIALHATDLENSVWIVEDNRLSELFSNGIDATSSGSGTGQQSIRIANNEIADVIGDGVRIHTFLADESALGQSIEVLGNTISGTLEGNGVMIWSFAGGDAHMTQLFKITSNSVSDAGGAGFDLINEADNGAELDQSFEIAGNQVSQALGVGIRVHGKTSHGTLRQDIAITDNDVADVGGSGLVLTLGEGSLGRVDGTVTQTALIADNTVEGSRENGIRLDVLTDTGFVTRDLAITGNSLVDIANNGISETRNLNEASELRETLLIAGNDISQGGIVRAIVLQSQAHDTAFAAVALTIKGNTLASAGTTVTLFNVAHDESNTTQTITIDDNIMSVERGQVLQLRNEANDGSTSTQIVDITDNESDGGEHGLTAANAARDDGTATQSFVYSGNAISTAHDGIGLENSGSGATQSLDATPGGNSISDIDDDGVVVAQFDGGTQTVTVLGGIAFFDIGDQDYNITNTGGGTQTVEDD